MISTRATHGAPLALVVAVLAAATACGQRSSAGPAPEAAPRTTVEVGPVLQDALGWMAENPTRASVVVAPGADEETLEWRATTARPTASTFKVVVLAAYARAVAGGDLRPDEQIPVAAVDRWLVEGTDGGAHREAMAALAGGDGIVLDDVVAAMIRFSDNAATDLLLDRLGPGGPADTAEALGLPALGAIASPTAGALLSVSGPTPEGIDRRITALARSTPQERAERAWLAARRFAADPDGSVATIQAGLSTLTDWERQLRLGAALPWWATPEDLAALLQGVVLDERLGADVAEIVLRHLSWPMEDPALAEDYAMAAAKDGVTAGVLTVIGLVRPARGTYADQPRIVVVTLTGLAQDDWSRFLDAEAHLELALAFGSDPALAGRILEDLRS